MAIDARISAVTFVSNGTCRLSLEDRNNHSVAGQVKLYIQNTDNTVREYGKSLVGCEIWGGAEKLMLGDKLIANRQSYTVIRLVENWVQVVQEYKEARTL